MGKPRPVPAPRSGGSGVLCPCYGSEGRHLGTGSCLLEGWLWSCLVHRDPGSHLPGKDPPAHPLLPLESTRHMDAQMRVPCTHADTHTRVHTHTLAHRHACAQGRALPCGHAALASTESGRNKPSRLCSLPEPLLALLCAPRGVGSLRQSAEPGQQSSRMQGRPSWGGGTDPQPGPQEGTCPSCTQGLGTAACSGGLGEGGPSTRQPAPGRTFLEARGPGPLSGPALLSRGVEARGTSSHLEMAVWTQTRDTGVPRGGRRTRERWNAWGGQGSRNIPGTQCWPEAA